MKPGGVVPSDVDGFLEQVMERQVQELERLKAARASWWQRRKQRQRLHEVEDEMEWLETRAMGVRRYIWGHGVLRLGGAIFVGSQIILPIANGQLPHSMGEWIFSLVAGMATMLLVGWIGGSHTWYDNEERHARRLQQMAEQEPNSAR